MRPRPQTDQYLAAVVDAIAKPGVWVDVRVFKTEYNASKTGECLAGGYLRVKPRRDEPARTGPNGERWLETAGPVAVRVVEVTDGWLLRVRA